LEKSLKILGFKVTTSYDIKRLDKRTGKSFITHALALNGKSNLERWVSIIGFSNYKNIFKYLFWKRNRFGLKQEVLHKISGPEGTFTQFLSLYRHNPAK